MQGCGVPAPMYTFQLPNAALIASAQQEFQTFNFRSDDVCGTLRRVPHAMHACFGVAICLPVVDKSVAEAAL